MLAGAGIAFAAGLSYLALHFIVYVGALRYKRAFQRERGIFLYHLVSAVLFAITVVAVTGLILPKTAVAIAFALVAAHGIYSLSFLELWSLAEGSYSITVMNSAAADPGLSREATIDALAQVGELKKSSRIRALTDLSLARREGDYWSLTRLGYCLAILFKGLSWLANIKKSG
jgi:hypothetical protein